MFQTSHLIVAFTALANPPGWGLELTVQEKIDACHKTFAAYVDTTESQFNTTERARQSVQNFLGTRSNSSIALSPRGADIDTAEPDESQLAERLFRNEAKKREAVTAFLAHYRSHRQHLIAFAQEFERIKSRAKHAHSLELLDALLNLKNCVQLHESPGTTSLNITAKVLAKNEKNSYLVPDEEYYPLIMDNLFARHLVERFYKK